MNKPNGWMIAGLCVATMVCLYQESRIRKQDRSLEAQRQELTAIRKAHDEAARRAADVDAAKEDVRRK